MLIVDQFKCKLNHHLREQCRVFEKEGLRDAISLATTFDAYENDHAEFSSPFYSKRDGDTFSPKGSSPARVEGSGYGGSKCTWQNNSNDDSSKPGVGFVGAGSDDSSVQ